MHCAAHAGFPFLAGMVLMLGTGGYSEPTKKKIAEVDPMRRLVRFEGEATFLDPKALPRYRVLFTPRKDPDRAPPFTRHENVHVGALEPHAPEDLGYTHRFWPLSFPQITLHAGTVATLSTQPHILFRPRRLVLGRNCDKLHVTTLIVGQASQLANWAGGIPGRIFAPTPLGLSEEDRALFDRLLTMKFDTADISQFVQVGLSNNTREDIDVSATMLGDVAF